MAQSVITSAFLHLKAQQSTSGAPVILDEFIFANVPGLNPDTPVSPDEGIPPEGQIVHRQAVEKAGVVNENAVAYSVTLGAELGDFDFNWVGLISKTSNTLAMIVHAPVQKKIRNSQGKQGNVLVRSMLMEYSGAKELTGITTPAQTWQIDFTARLGGMDERQRLENIDIYGPAGFAGDGWLVVKSGTRYTVRRGLGYVAGLRAELAEDQTLTDVEAPTRVWLDVCWKGTLTSVWDVQHKITVARALADYTEEGYQHYVFALADIDSAGNVTDLRPKETLIDRRRDDAIRAHERSRNHPDATLTEKGFTQLSNQTDSDDETKAATPKALRDAIRATLAASFTKPTASLGTVDLNTLGGVEHAGDYYQTRDNAATPGRHYPVERAGELRIRVGAWGYCQQEYTSWNPPRKFIRTVSGNFNNNGPWSEWVEVGGIEDANTSRKGIVQLSSATDSTDETRAATPKAVKDLKDQLMQQISDAIADLISSSPDTLDTLNELAAALGNDPNFAATVSQQIGEKLAKNQNGADIPDKAQFRTSLGLGNAAILNVGTEWMTVASGDDPRIVNAVQKGGSTMTGKLNLPETSAFGINTSNRLGGSSLTVGDNDTGIKQDGDGVLAVYANGQRVFLFSQATQGTTTDLSVGSSIINTEGDIYGSEWGNRWLSEWLNDRLGAMGVANASTTQRGIVQLSTSTSSTSTTMAATPSAVKAAYDLANGKYTAQDASTSRKGIVQLSDSTSSTSQTQAATSKAISDLKNELTLRISTAIAGLVNSSPAALDTLNELAAALGNDPNFSATITSLIGQKLAKDQNGADIPNKSRFIDNVGLRDTVNRASNAIQKGGDTMTGKLNLPQTSSFAINTNNGLGGSSLVIGDSDTGFKQNGDGVLDVYANGVHVFRFINGTNVSLKPLEVRGMVNAQGEVWAASGGGRLAGDGNVYGGKWGGWLFDYLNRSFVRDIRLASEQYFGPGSNVTSWNNGRGDGGVVTGLSISETGSNSADNVNGYYFRHFQKYVNGNWYNVGSL